MPLRLVQPHYMQQPSITEKCGHSADPARMRTCMCFKAAKVVSLLPFLSCPCGVAGGIVKLRNQSRSKATHPVGLWLSNNSTLSKPGPYPALWLWLHHTGSSLRKRCSLCMTHVKDEHLLCRIASMGGGSQNVTPATLLPGTTWSPGPPARYTTAVCNSLWTGFRLVFNLLSRHTDKALQCSRHTTSLFDN